MHLSLKSSNNGFKTLNEWRCEKKESVPARPKLSDPYWLTYVDVTPEVSFYVSIFFEANTLSPKKYYI